MLSETYIFFISFDNLGNRFDDVLRELNPQKVCILHSRDKKEWYAAIKGESQLGEFMKVVMPICEPKLIEKKDMLKVSPITKEGRYYSATGNPSLLPFNITNW